MVTEPEAAGYCWKIKQVLEKIPSPGLNEYLTYK